MKKESQNEEKIKNRRKNYVIVILIIIIILLLFLLIRKIGKIEHLGPNIPTGNIDIFKIKCDCEDGCINKEEKTEDNQNVVEEPKEEQKIEPVTPEEEEEEPEIETDPSGLLVYDDEKEWDNLELRIFSNPAFEYQSKIAPGSYNSYMFIIQNINDFDVDVKMKFIVENDKNINMNYKLRSNNIYYVGSQTTYEKIDNKEIKKIEIPANEAKTFILDWKWIDNNNDAVVGFDITSHYKLSIDVGANQKA